MIKATDLCSPPQSAEKATLDHPLEHLVACHRRIEDRLDTLERVIPHLAGRREESLTAIQNSLRFFDTNGTWHTADEEESLFPRLAPFLNAEEKAFVQNLERQHQEAESIFDALKKAALVLSAESPCSVDAIEEYERLCRRLCEIYRAHIAAEDSRLPELGRRLLPEIAMKELSREMKLRRGLEA